MEFSAQEAERAEQVGQSIFRVNIVLYKIESASKRLFTSND